MVFFLYNGNDVLLGSKQRNMQYADVQIFSVPPKIWNGQGGVITHENDIPAQKEISRQSTWFQSPHEHKGRP